MDNLTDDLSNNQDKHKSDQENEENNDPIENHNDERDLKQKFDNEPDHFGTALDKIDEISQKENEVVEQPDTGAQPHKH